MQSCCAGHSHHTHSRPASADPSTSSTTAHSMLLTAKWGFVQTSTKLCSAAWGSRTLHRPIYQNHAWPLLSPGIWSLMLTVPQEAGGKKPFSRSRLEPSLCKVRLLQIEVQQLVTDHPPFPPLLKYQQSPSLSTSHQAFSISPSSSRLHQRALDKPRHLFIWITPSSMSGGQARQCHTSKCQPCLTSCDPRTHTTSQNQARRVYSRADTSSSPARAAFSSAHTKSVLLSRKTDLQLFQPFPREGFC